MTALSTSHQGLRKTLRYGLLALLLSVAPMGQANAAITVTDLYADNNTITGQLNPDPNVTVFEDYNELTRIPYPSHDGYAIVNSSYQYFDKLVTYTGATSGTSSQLLFQVYNSTPWAWSDYHIELWDSTFTTRLTTLSVTSGNDQFTSSNNVGGVISFYAPGSHNSLETGNYWITTDLYAINGTADGQFGIRQVATTVPEPGTIMLMGIGALGMFGVKNAKRREADVA